MGMSKSEGFKLAFNIAKMFLPKAVGDGIDHAVEVAKEGMSGGEKKAVAVARASASESIKVLNQLAGGELSKHPKFVAIMGRVNDVLYEAAKETAELVEAVKAGTEQVDPQG